MQLSVIILNFNVQHFLELCVLSVQKAIQNIDAEIIVIDNYSADGSCEMIESHFPNVKLIKNLQNYGFPKGNNIGVQSAKGHYLCILNPDTVVAEDTFEKILQFAKAQQNFGIAGCKLIDGSGKYLPESKRGTPTPWVAMTKILGLYKFFPNSKLFNQYYAQHLDKNQSGKVEILVGAFMILERSLYNKIGGFDENCFMYADDIDLSYRVLKEGKYNYYFHQTTVIHYKGESTIRDEKYLKRFQEAMTFFYKKHFKVSVFFDIFMKIGILFFAIFKQQQGNATFKNKVDKYILVSDNKETQSKISEKLQDVFEIQSIEFKLLPKLSSAIATEIILDSNALDFKTIIHIIEMYRNKNITFKIIPRTRNFMIGSNSSLDRGEVIQF